MKQKRRTFVALELEEPYMVPVHVEGPFVDKTLGREKFPVTNANLTKYR